MPASQNRLVINVVARDRVGIIADVSETLYQLGANLEATSQTVVWGWFTMIICASFPPGTKLEKVRDAVEQAGPFRATVLPFAGSSAGLPPDGEPYVATVVGDDRPGIIRALTRCLAENKVNIVDVWNEVRDGRFIVLFHLEVPPPVEARALRRALDEAAKGVGVTVSLQHQDIFTATNSLDVHARRKSTS
jgi:glycine cleavage system transcriptional repressor